MFHFTGSWRSNTGYFKYIDKKDNKYLWTYRCLNKENSIMSKDNKSCHYKICKMNIPISVTFPHKKHKLELAFGTDFNDDNPCEGSYGVSEIRLYVR